MISEVMCISIYFERKPISLRRSIRHYHSSLLLLRYLRLPKWNVEKYMFIKESFTVSQTIRLSAKAFLCVWVVYQRKIGDGFSKDLLLEKKIGSFDSNLIVSLTNYYWLALDRTNPNWNFFPSMKCVQHRITFDALGSKHISMVFVSNALLSNGLEIIGDCMHENWTQIQICFFHYRLWSRFCSVYVASNS